MNEDMLSVKTLHKQVFMWCSSPARLGIFTVLNEISWKNLLMHF
jgi:hypothetical protein